MAKAEIAKARSPRGAKSVSQSFLTALETIPSASRAAVSKAALAMIREQMKTQRAKAKVGAAKATSFAAKQKDRKPAAEKPVAAKAAPKSKTLSAAKGAHVKRGSRKLPKAPVAA